MTKTQKTVLIAGGAVVLIYLLQQKPNEPGFGVVIAEQGGQEIWRSDPGYFTEGEEFRRSDATAGT